MRWICLSYQQEWYRGIFRLLAIAKGRFLLSRKGEKNMKKVLKEDSLRLQNERVLLENQIKSMIDLHLNKVEHEYSNLTMWAAVLTILFLVFSFYSIFKMMS